MLFFFFFKQKTAYEMRISDWSSDVCSSDLIVGLRPGEKLYEELFDEGERQLPSVISGIKEAEPIPVPLVTLNDAFDELARASASNDSANTRALVRRLLESSAPAKPETEAEPQTETEKVQVARSRQTRPTGTDSHTAYQKIGREKAR